MKDRPSTLVEQVPSVFLLLMGILVVISCWSCLFDHFRNNLGYLALNKAAVTTSNVSESDEIAYLQRAECLFSERRQEGITVSGRAYFLLGMTYQKQRGYQNALRAYQTATDLDFAPTDQAGASRLYYELGWIYDHFVENRTAAENAYRKAAEIADVPYDTIDAGNLLRNGGFEYTGLYWGISSPPGAKTSYDNSEARSGRRSLRIHFDGTQDVNYYHAVTFVPVEPNTAYTLTLYVKTLNLDASGVAMEAYDADQGYEHWYGGNTGPLLGTNDWTKMMVSFVSGVDTRNLRVV